MHHELSIQAVQGNFTEYIVSHGAQRKALCNAQGLAEFICNTQHGCLAVRLPYTG